MRRGWKLGLAAASSFALGLALSPLVSVAENSDTYGMLNVFNEVLQTIHNDYVEPVKDNDLIEAAINGMLSSLDPHSSYMNEKAYKEMQIQTKGEFGGLGIEVTMQDGLVKVVSPIDDTPAFKAGIKAGDYISAINDESVSGMTLADAVDKMRGAVDTKIKLTVLREGEAEPLEFTMIRATIHIVSVRSHVYGDIVYFRIAQFNEQVIDKLQSEWEKQKKVVGDVKGIVLDLRNNPGGLLDQAVAVSDAFLDEGEIVSTRGRDPENAKRYMAHGGNMAKGIPVVVLINNGSASASEIVAGALQDHKRAIIMGTKSFGKGSVQTIIPLPGHGAIRLTTARYYTPSGHSIQAKGIVPDIVVEQAKIEPLKKPGMQRLEASLPRRLRGEDEKDAKPDDGKIPFGKAQGKDADKKDRKADDKKHGEEDITDHTMEGAISANEDFQLSNALDLLRSLAVYKQKIN